MQLSLITADNHQPVPLAADGLVILQVTIGHTVYKLSERDGQLSVKVDGDLVVRPSGSNGATLAREL